MIRRKEMKEGSCYKIIQYDNMTGNPMAFLLEDLKVKDVMNYFPQTLFKEESINSADLLMKSKNIEHILVVNSEGESIGIITNEEIKNCYLKIFFEKNYLDPQLESNSITSLMIEKLLKIDIEDSVENAARMLSKSKSGCLAVIKNDTLAGTISKNDIIKGLTK